MRTTPSIPSLAGLLMMVAAAAAQAGSIEDNFRSFIDKLKASGKAPALAAGPREAPEVAKASLARRTDSLPLGKDHYVLFVANGCRSCPALVKKLEKRTGGTLEVMNISTSTTAREAFTLSKAKGVPAMLVGTQVISGYSDKLFDRARVLSFNDKGVSQQGQGS